MGALRFREQLKSFGRDIPLEEAERILGIYRSTYNRIKQLWYSANDALHAMMSDTTTYLGANNQLVVEGKKGIRLPNGFYISYPNLREEPDESGERMELVYDTRRGKSIIKTRIYGGKVVENVCQALARIVIGEHLLEVNKKHKVVMTVHDAIGCIAPLGEVREAYDYVDICMRKRPDWAPDLPLDCEGGFGPAYGKCNKVKRSK